MVLNWSESSGSFAMNALVNGKGDVQASRVRHLDLKIHAIYRVDGEIPLPLVLPLLIVFARTRMSLIER